MAFAQVPTYRESGGTSKIRLCADGQQAVPRPAFVARFCAGTLADANERRDWRIYHDFAQVLIARTRRLYANEPLGTALGANGVRPRLDHHRALLVLVSLGSFPTLKAAIKLHTLLDLRGNIPCFVRLSTAKTADSQILHQLIPEPGSFYVMDRGYNYFGVIPPLDASTCVFCRPLSKQYHLRPRRLYAVDRSTGLSRYPTVRFRDRRTAKHYPLPLRRVTFYDLEHRRRFILMTNAFQLPAPWRFHGCTRAAGRSSCSSNGSNSTCESSTSLDNRPNAVKTQVWIAISADVLVALLKLRVEDRTQPLRNPPTSECCALFEKTADLPGFLKQNHYIPITSCPNQLPLFDF